MKLKGFNSGIVSLSRSLYLLILFGLSGSSSIRCWIGVIDQINPPWLVISRESGEQVELPLAESDPQVREGDWVIYWTQQKRVERLNSLGSRMESKRNQQWLNLLIQSPNK